MWLELHSLVFPSWSFLRITLPFFSTTLYDTGSKLVDSLLSRVLLRVCDLPRQYHCIVLTAFCLHTLSAEVSPARLSREEAVANGPRWFFHLEWLLLEVCLWGVDPSGARLGTTQTLCDVWFDTERKFGNALFQSLPSKVAILFIFSRVSLQRSTSPLLCGQ